MKLRTQFTLISLSILVVPVIAAVIFIVVRVQFFSDSLSPVGNYDQLRNRIIAELEEDPESLDLASLAPDAKGTRIAVLGRDLSVVDAEPPAETHAQPPAASEPGSAAQQPGAHGRLMSSLLEGGHTTTVFDSMTTDSGDRYYLVVSFSNADTLRRANQMLVLETIYVFLAVLLGLAVTAFFIFRSTDRSIRTLQRATEQIGRGELDFGLVPKGADEIVALTKSFDEMREALKEEQAKRSRFLMSVSHDLKTPLTSIKGYLEAIQDGLASDPEMLERYVDVVHGKTELLEDRIAHLIELGRLETGNWELRLKEVELEPLAREIAGSLGEDAHLFQRRFTAEIRLAPETTATLDRTMIIRCFENLFSNAVRFTGEGGEIRFDAWEEQQHVQLKLSDDGSGIADSEINQVFDPYYRGQGNTRGSGLGLGLSIVKSVIEAHGFRVDVSSSPGRGTSFVVSMPISIDSPRSS